MCLIAQKIQFSVNPAKIQVIDCELFVCVLFEKC